MKTKMRIIKDTDGEYITVKAETVQYGGNGLYFFIDNKIVAHFPRYASFRCLSLAKQEAQQTGRD